MTSTSELDLGPLSWVKEEIDLALERTREALSLFAANPADSAQLKYARTHLHQAHGALSIIGLDGVTQFSETLEQLLADVDSAKLEATASLGQLAQEAVAAIRAYLDEVAAGLPNQPLRLLDVYRRLAQARGHERMASSDLFFPDLSLRPPKRSEEPPALSTDALGRQLKSQRLRFERGFLRWLRNADEIAGLIEMREAVAAIEATQALPAARAFWWVTIALLDALAAGQIPVDFQVKKLCARIDLQMRRLLEGSRTVAERLMRDALYFVAIAKGGGEQVEQVKQAYRLDGLVPSRTEDSEPLKPVLRAMRETITAAKETWNKFCAGAAVALPQFHDQTVILASKGGGLINDHLARLVAGIAEVAQWLRKDPLRQNDATAMEVATALLLTESALENYDQLAADFFQQVEVVVSRLGSLVRGEPLEELSAPLLDEITRRAQERLMMSQIAREILINLTQIEQSLDAFFRDPARREELAALGEPLKQVEGALVILGEDRAVALLRDCAARIGAYADPENPSDPVAHEKLAHDLSGLGFFVEALQYGPADLEEVLKPVRPRRRPEPEMGEDARAHSVEDELEQQKRETRTLLESLRDRPEDEQTRESLKLHLETIRQDASLVADSQLEGEASAALSVLSGTPDSDLADQVGDAAGSLSQAPRVELAAPSAETLRLAEAPSEEVDAELLAIFIEEAKEVLGTIGESLDQSREKPYELEYLTTIRRGFHTLKGSGRMVGLNELGETAWAIEQVMNNWLQAERNATPDLHQMIAMAHGLFGDWVAQLAAGGDTRMETAALIAQLERIKTAGAGVGAGPEVAATPEIVVDAGLETQDAGENPRSEETPADEEITIDLPNEDEGQPFEPVGDVPSDIPSAAGEEDTVVLGARTLSRTLFEMYVNEAQGHLAVLRQSLNALKTSPQPPSDGMIRAAHTLAGISGTVGIEQVSRLALSLEHALGRLSRSAEFCNGGQIGLLGTVISTLDAMLASLGEKQVPHDAEGLAAELDEMARNTPTAPVELTVVLPEEPDAIAPQAGQADEITPERIEPIQPEAVILVEEPETPAMGAPATPVRNETESEQEGGARETAAQEATEEIVFELPTDDTATFQPLASVWDKAPAVDGDEGVTGQAPSDLAEPDPLVETGVPAVEALEIPALEQIEEGETERRKLRLRDDLDEQLLPVFLEEAVDLLRQIGHELRSWRSQPQDQGISASLARLLHTLKGSARMAGAMGMGELIHSMETRLEQAGAAGTVSETFLDEFDTSFDRANFLLSGLQRRAAGERDGEPEAVATADAPTPAQTVGTLERPREDAESAMRAMLRVRADLVDRLVNEAGEMSIARSRIEGEMRVLRSSLLDLTENVIRLRGQLREIEIQAESQMQSRMAQAQEVQGEFDPLEFDRFTRFQEITRMMAESVNDVTTVQHALLQNLDHADAAVVSQARQNRELSQALMGIRMVPFNLLADRLYRIVRQTAKELGRKANLDIRGGQIEMDRSVLEKMIGPIEHLLRNAIIHGLETSSARQGAEKPEIGQLGLTLSQEGNEIVIELSDDGAGLDYERIRAKAIEQGLLAADLNPDPATLAEFIFQPGFSTARELSEIAGRGVGMDVVKSETAQLGGRIEVSSSAGQGTRFRIYLPLTLAVTQALLVRVGGRTHAIPSIMIEQVLDLTAAAVEQIRTEGGTDWLGNRYPYYYLPRLLGDSHSMPEPQRRHAVLLLRAGTQRICVQVDEMRGNQEVVVKNIGAQLARVIGIAGATVLGDGEVVLILNPIALASRDIRTLPSEIEPQAPADTDTIERVRLPTVMIVDDSLTVRKITGRLLSREGYQVLTAKDGVDALEQLLDSVPDVMLVDIEMPRMDGFDLTRNVRADKRLSQIPIIMITSRTAEKHRNYAKEIGVNHYLGKPYQEDELLELIAGYVRQKADLAPA